MVRPVAACGLLVIAACGPSVHVMRHGAARPPRGEDCKIRLAEDIDPQAATLRYQLVGQVVISGVEQPADARVRQLVRARACALGGKIIVPGAAIGSAGHNTETYLVLGDPRTEPLTIAEAMQAGSAGVLAVAKSAKQDIVVAVFDIADRTERLAPEQREQLSQYLAVRLAQQRGYRVAPRDQLRARLAGQRRASYRDCYATSCQIEIGKALAAQKSLSTQLLQVGDGCALVASLFDLQSETSERAATVPCSCSAGEHLLGSVNELVSRLVAP